MYALDGKPKTVDEAIDRIQFYQHFRQSRPHALLTRKKEVVVGNSKSERSRKAESEIRELKSRTQQLVKTLKASLTRSGLEPR